MCFLSVFDRWEDVAREGLTVNCIGGTGENELTVSILELPGSRSDAVQSGHDVHHAAPSGTSRRRATPA